MFTDIALAYQFLKHAEKGYRIALENGSAMYEKSYSAVMKLLADAQFDDVRREYDELFEDEE